MKHWRDQLRPAPNERTTAWRTFTGEGLRWGGVWIDVFDGHWLVQTRKDKFPEALHEAVPELARSLWWKRRDKEQKAAPRWIAGEKIDEPFLAEENGMKFWIDFQAGYSQGIFLDQRENRRRVRDHSFPDDRVLNTFAYTGAFSIAAAKAGAITSTLDLSKNYLEWAKRNFTANDLDPADHYFCKGDVFEWLRTFRRQERLFRGVILDPPTFSRNRKGKVFKVERDYPDLVRLACGVLEEEAWLLCCANTHGVSTVAFEKAVREGVRQGRRITQKVESHPMPPEFAGEDYLKSVWVNVA